MMKQLRNRSKQKIIMIIVFITGITISIESCKVSQKVANKSGAQLWSENCQHCHNTPDPTSFSGDQWETIGMHMQTRALITESERNKIVEFLQQSDK